MQSLEEQNKVLQKQWYDTADQYNTLLGKLHDKHAPS